MHEPSKRLLSSILFCATSVALGCSVEPADPEGEALVLEDLEDEAIDELVAEAEDGDEARVGGGNCRNDRDPPRLTLQTVVLWPPDHRYERIDVDDCIRRVEECDPDWTAEIEWVSSDEPENGQGDGNTNDDIVCVDDDTVRCRAERQGNGDGRVYTIKFEAKDRRNNRRDYYCKVVVPHDRGQGNQVVDSGAEYRERC